MRIREGRAGTARVDHPAADALLRRGTLTSEEPEAATLRAALDAAACLPRGMTISLNVSPALVLDEYRIRDALANVDRPVMLELTERDRIDGYAALRAAMSRLGAETRWAIDDAGAGYSSLQHILELPPHVAKLDRTMIAGIIADPARQALVAGMLHFGDALGSTVVAEGIETEAERGALQTLGLRFGQGYLFGQPAAAASISSVRLAHPLDDAERHP